MKTLTLMRHAKSDWNHPGLADHERPLNKRGQAAAPEMAKRLAARGDAAEMPD
ncbi:MAG: histidine phosphatase family protein, partial [Gammaproteobacteria bacterium]|nr:histidine phosphatase family protein [Gammaproteobacteria bacterium]